MTVPGLQTLLSNAIILFHDALFACSLALSSFCSCLWTFLKLGKEVYKAEKIKIKIRENFFYILWPYHHHYFNLQCVAKRFFLKSWLLQTHTAFTAG